MSRYLSSKEVEFKDKCNNLASEICEKMYSIASHSNSLKSELEDVAVLQEKAIMLSNQTDTELSDSSESKAVSLSLSDLYILKLTDIDKDQLSLLSDSATTAASSASLTRENISEAFASMEYSDDED